MKIKEVFRAIQLGLIDPPSINTIPETRLTNLNYADDQIFTNSASGPNWSSSRDVRPSVRMSVERVGVSCMRDFVLKSFIIHC